jgi:hypothetical protein
MKVTKEIVSQRVESLLDSTDKFYSGQNLNWQIVDETTFGSIALISLIYNDDHEFIKQIKTARDTFLRGNRGDFYCENLRSTLKGILQTVKFEIINNLLGTLENQVRGEIFGDFISIAKNLLTDGHKDAAAVLACGALEDSLKKFAISNGLAVEGKDLSTVINSLKGQGLIKGAQAGIVQSYVQLRNKAFHAQFEKIEMPEVASLISFVEQFLLSNFE